jgi:hypothetical protein
MKMIHYKHRLLIYILIVIQALILTFCNTGSYDSKQRTGTIGFSGFYLDMNYVKVKSVMDSLFKTGELHYFETTDVVGSTQKNLYSDFAEISPALYAKVNLRGSYIIDQRLTSIQLTLCTRQDMKKPAFSFNCSLTELKKLFESYTEKYGKPTFLTQGEKYDWLAKKISNVYLPGPKGRWLFDKIYYWEKGNYIIYFDFGYPESAASSENMVKKPDVPVVSDSTGAPIIYYDFTPEYLDKLLEKAGSKKEEEFK